jgi:hypothetical protein
MWTSETYAENCRRSIIIANCSGLLVHQVQSEDVDGACRKQASLAAGCKQLVYRSVRKLIAPSVLGDERIIFIPTGSVH